MTLDLLTPDDVERFVSEIEIEYKSTLGLILSEFDAQCLLYSKISTHLRHSNHNRMPTRVPSVFASPLHTEIKFLDAQGHLTIQPDITVLDVSAIRMDKSNPNEVILSKGFAFSGSAFVVELKFCKNRKGLDAAFANKIRIDCEKLAKLRSRLYPMTESPTFHGCVVVFNRTGVICEEFRNLQAEFANSETSKVIYATAHTEPAGGA